MEQLVAVAKLLSAVFGAALSIVLVVLLLALFVVDAPWFD